MAVRPLQSCLNQSQGGFWREPTHDHDVGVGQDGAVLVGGFALIDGAVAGPGLLQDDLVVKDPPAGGWHVCGRKHGSRSMRKSMMGGWAAGMGHTALYMIYQWNSSP